VDAGQAGNHLSVAVPDANGSGDPTTVEFRPRLAYRAVLLALGLLAAGLLFTQLTQLVLLVLIAVIVALPMAASARRLRRFHVPRALGALLALLTGGALIGGILYLAIPAFINQVNAYVTALPGTVAHFERSLNHTFGLRPGTVTTSVTRFSEKYVKHPSTLLGPVSSVGVSLATAVGDAVIVLISAIYMAISPQPLANGIVRLFGPDQRDQTLYTLERIRRTWLDWLRALLVDMLVTGGLLYVGLKLDGLPFAIGFAIFGALLKVIPGYGPVLSALPPVILGLTGTWERGLIIALIFMLANQMSARLIPAAVRGAPVRLHPAVIAIGTLISASLFGVLGLFIAVPLISLTLILVDELWSKPHGSATAEPAGVSARAADRPAP
jgi:predicted PurR-regulated permease PerM